MQANPNPKIAPELLGKILAKMKQGTQEIKLAGRKGIVLLGNTCGKTALLYFLADKSLLIAEDVGRQVFQVPPNQKTRHATITSCSDESEFHPPNVFTVGDTSIIDCSSFKDYHEIETNLLSYVSLRQIFERLESVRFVICISMAGFVQAKMTECSSVINRFLSMFTFNEHFTVNTLVESVVLVITQYEPSRLTQENILNKLKTLSTTNATNQPNLARLLEIVVEKNKVLIFKTPANYKKAEGPEMLSAIVKLSSEWKWVSDHGRVPPDNLDFNFIMKAMPKDQQLLSEALLSELNEWVISICAAIGTTVGLVRDRLTNPAVKELFGGWKELIKDNVPPVKEGMKGKSVPDYFRDLKFIEMMWKLRQNQPDFATFTEETVIAFGTDILRLMKEFLKLTKEETQLIDDMAFVLQQKVNQTRLVFVKGKENADDIGKKLSCSVAASKLGSFHTEEYAKIELQFFTNYHLEKSKDQRYYDQTKEYLNKHIPKNPALLDKLSKLQEIESEEMAGKVGPGKVEKLLIDSILSTEKLKEHDNQVYFVDCEKRKYRKLGSICFQQGLWEEALEMYYVINDINMIEQCYAKLIEKHPDRALEFYQDKGNYFLDQALFERAKAAYIQGMSLADDRDSEKHFGQLILKCDPAQQGSYIEQNSKRIQNNQFYNRRRHMFKFQSISDKLSMNMSNGIDMSELIVKGPVQPPSLLKPNAQANMHLSNNPINFLT